MKKIETTKRVGNGETIVPPKEVKHMKAAALHKKPEVPAPIPEKVPEKEEEIAQVEVVSPPTE